MGGPHANGSSYAEARSPSEHLAHRRISARFATGYGAAVCPMLSQRTVCQCATKSPATRAHGDHMEGTVDALNPRVRSLTSLGT